MLKHLTLLFLAPWLLSMLYSCTTTTSNLYYWGHYEKIVLDIFTNPVGISTSEQITTLNTNIRTAHDKGLKVPPGLYAHLGTLYASEGKIEKAMNAFDQEKKLYPESIHFIDGMLNRARGLKAAP